MSTTLAPPEDREHAREDDEGEGAADPHDAEGPRTVATDGVVVGEAAEVQLLHRRPDLALPGLEQGKLEVTALVGETVDVLRDRSVGGQEHRDRWVRDLILLAIVGERDAELGGERLDRDLVAAQELPVDLIASAELVEDLCLLVRRIFGALVRVEADGDDAEVLVARSPVELG